MCGTLEAKCNSILICLISFATLALAADRQLRYQNIPVIQERLFNNRTIFVDKEVKCAAKCAIMEKGCDGYRYRPDDGGECQLGEYNPDDENKDTKYLPETLYQTGETNYSTMWKLHYSDDFCLVRFPGIGSKVQMEQFCLRMEGSIPRLDDKNDIERFRQAGRGTPLDITEDQNGDWRYPDDSVVIEEAYRPFGSAPAGKEDQTCARWKYVNDEVNIVERITCTNRNSFMCQFC